MADVITRWRERCQAEVRSRLGGSLGPLAVAQGIEIALGVAEWCSEASDEFTVRAIERRAQQALMLPREQLEGLRLALAWLKEEVDRG